MMTRFSRIVLAAIAASFTPAQPLLAQSHFMLKGLEGKRVRLTAALLEDDRAAALAIQGTVFEVRGDSIHMLQDGGLATHVALTAIRTLHVHAGKDHWAGARKGAIVGAGIGLFATAISPADCSDDGYGYDCRADGSRPTFAEYAWSNVSLFGILGSIVGAIRGADRWNAVITQQQRVTIAPAMRGFHMRLSF